MPKLKGRIDYVSVSLNESTAEKYDKVCRPAFSNAYEHLQDFVRACVAAGLDTTLSVVDVIGSAAIEECRTTAERLGAKFRVRKLITPKE